MRKAGARTNAGICSLPACEAEWIANPTHPIGACGPPETGRLPVGCETGALLAGRMHPKNKQSIRQCRRGLKTEEGWRSDREAPKRYGRDLTLGNGALEIAYG